MTWQPPPGFRSLPSAVPGVSVYGPDPDGGASATCRCSRCGATTAFDPRKSALHCSNCGHSEAEGSAVGLDGEKQLFAITALNAKGWGGQRRELHCDGCGASLAVETGSLASACPFCGSVRLSLRDLPEDVLRPGFVLPFAFTPDQLQKSLRAWLRDGWMHPASLSRIATSRFEGIYVPFWLFTAQLSSRWKATVGYDRVETHTDAQGHTHSRTVTDWRPEKGEASLAIPSLPVAGTHRLGTRLISAIAHYDYQALLQFRPDAIAGWNAQAFDVPLATAWDQGRAEMRSRAETACRSQIHGQHVQQFSMAVDFSEEGWRYVLLPVYLTSYTWQGKVYQVLVNGQNGKVEGQKPVIWRRVWLAISAILSPGILSMLVGLPLLLLGGSGVFCMVLGLILLIVGGVISAGIHSKARQSEQAA